ncbi:hypothetical protein AAY473_010381 [Plecturocebus cupreus]
MFQTLERHGFTMLARMVSISRPRDLPTSASQSAGITGRQSLALLLRLECSGAIRPPRAPKVLGLQVSATAPGLNFPFQLARGQRPHDSSWPPDLQSVGVLTVADNGNCRLNFEFPFFRFQLALVSSSTYHHAGCRQPIAFTLGPWLATPQWVLTGEPQLVCTGPPTSPGQPGCDDQSSLVTNGLSVPVTWWGQLITGGIRWELELSLPLASVLTVCVLVACLPPSLPMAAVPGHQLPAPTQTVSSQLAKGHAHLQAPSSKMLCQI